MAKQMKECRVCGKQYEACRSARTGSTVFNWREMCCSPECGQIYLRRVEEARNPSPKTKAKRILHTKVEEPVVETQAPPVDGVDELQEGTPAES